MKMRICPKCRKVMVDVTGKGEEYGCWGCTSTFKDFSELMMRYVQNKVPPELRMYAGWTGSKMEVYYGCPICEMNGSGVVKFTQDEDVRKRYAQHLKVAHDFVVDEKLITTNMGDLAEFDLKRMNKNVNKVKK